MVNYLNPKPDSNEELLDILIKLCDSNIVSRILGISATIDVDLKPKCKKFYLPIINLSTPLAYGYYYYYDFDYECSIYKKNDYKDFPIQSGEYAKENKTLNLYIEPEDKAEIRLKNCSQNPKYRSIYLIPSGLKGIQKIAYFINKGFIDNDVCIGNVIDFAIEAYLLWDTWIHLVESKTEQEILNLVGNGTENIEFWLDERDNVIFIDSKTKTIELGKNLPVKSFDIFIKETWNNKYKRELSHKY